MQNRVLVEGQVRARALSQTLAIAREAAARAGVTRLADMTGLARFGIPVFQAVRPYSRSLSVSQGKGLTRMAAMVSALLEAAELSVAESFDAGSAATAEMIAGDARNLWCDAPRDALAIHLDPERRRCFTVGRSLFSGMAVAVPRDLLSLDFTQPHAPDIARSSAGLATGNTPEEATASAVAELLERHFEARFRHAGPRERRACELDLASVTDPIARSLIDRIIGRGFGVRAWSIGQDAGIAAFRCVITDRARSGPSLPPAGGSGCHASRSVALLRAVLEAVQSRITVIAGARDDLTPADYGRGGELSLALVLGGLSFGGGALPWERVPDHPATDPSAMLATLLTAAETQSRLPVLLFTHEPLHPDLAVVHAIAPGLEDLCREHVAAAASTHASPKPPSPIRVSGRRRPVLFVGPSLPRSDIPDGIEARPPAVCGDLSDLLADPPPAIGLIDGCFEIAATVWHKEILDLLASGVPVLGGASLGALRAAELCGQGMIGIGAIFEQYRDGRVSRDDAVMISHAPPELAHAPLTIALVDAEAILHDLDMPDAERRMLLRIVRTMHFADRTWPAILDIYRSRTGGGPTITAEALIAAPSLKQADARRLVAALLSPQDRPRTAPPPMTRFYRIMRANRLRARR